MLVEMVRAYYQHSLINLSNFKSGDEAFERRGEVRSAKMFLDILSEINQLTEGVNDDSPISTGHAGTSRGIPIDRTAPY